jgi:hypothetical protein
MTWVVTAAAFVLVAAVVAGCLHSIRRRSRQKEPAYNHFRCSGCKRRLRYLTRQAGHRGRCPTCKRELTFPNPSGLALARPALSRGV